MKTTAVRFAALCAFLASPLAPAFGADQPPVVERAPDPAPAKPADDTAALRDEISRLKATLGERAKELQIAKAAIDNLSAQNRQLDAALAAALARAQQLASANKPTDAAAPSAADLAKLQSEKTALEKQLADTRDAETELRRQLAAATAAPDQSAKIADLESRLAAGLQSQAALQAEIEKLKSADADRTRLASELAALSQEKSALEKQLADAAKSTPSPDLSAKLAELESKLSTSLQSYSVLQAENEKLKSADADRTRLASELDVLRQEKSALEARLADAARSAPPADLAAKLAETESKLEVSLRSYSLLQAENDRLAAESARQLAATQTTSARAASEAASQLAGLSNELRNSQAQAAALATENSSLRTRLALLGPPPGTVLASPVRPGTAAAAAAVQPAPASPAPAADPAAPAAPRTHIVAAGDTLAKLARRYYGSASRWDEILRANRDVIKNENVLPLGATLKIP